MSSPNYYCETCADPDESCQYNGTWQGIATFYCPDCESEFEVPRNHFSEDGDYVGEPKLEQAMRYELRGGHGNWAIFDTMNHRIRSWHSDKQFAESIVKNLNKREGQNGDTNKG